LTPVPFKVKTLFLRKAVERGKATVTCALRLRVGRNRADLKVEREREKRPAVGHEVS
jgi:hypothetical protein